MGLFDKIKAGASTFLKAAGNVVSNPIIASVAGMIPGGAAVLNVAKIALNNPLVKTATAALGTPAPTKAATAPLPVAITVNAGKKPAPIIVTKSNGLATEYAKTTERMRVRK